MGGVGKVLGLNIGSGQRRFESVPECTWVNIDCVSRPPDQVPDVVCDVGKEPLPYNADTVDYVVLSHIIEHFGCGEADSMLKECLRVLKPNGSLIATVPDLRALAQRWLVNQVDDFIFMINTFGPYQGYESDRHKWGFSQQSLLDYVSRLHSWTSIRRFDWRPIAGLDLARDWWIASVEAIK